MATVDTARAGEQELESTEKVVAGTSTVEAIAGIGAVVLPILAIIGVLPIFLASIATIVIGAALMIEGGGISAKYQALAARIPGRAETSELAGGMTVQLLGGAAGVALGILALLGISSLQLMAVAVIIFGGTLMLGAGSVAQLNSLSIRGAVGVTETQREVARQATNSAAAAQVLVGIGAAVLGIIVLAGIAMPAEVTVLAVALLGVGGSILLTGTAVGGRMASMLHHAAV